MKPTRREWATHTGLFILVFAAYMMIGRMVSAPVVVLMPHWVPFLPWLAVPYLLQVVVSYFLVLAVRDRALRRASVKAYFAAFAVTSLVWLLYPTMMLRPSAPDAWWNWPFQVMAGLDLPLNILPAGHILMPVILCWAFALDRPRWLWWLVPCELVGTVAIVTTWQHRPIDVFYGVALAVVFGLLFGIGRPRAPA